MGRHHPGAKHVASSDKMIKVHRRNAVHAGTLRAKLDKLDVECRHKVNRISHEIFNIYFQEELPRERDILNRKLRKVPSEGSLMTLRSTGNEVFLYHTPRDRPMSRHPLLRRDAADGFQSMIPEESEPEEDKADELEESEDSNIGTPGQTLQNVSNKPENTVKYRKNFDNTKETVSMLGRKPLPKFLPPMCRTYIDLLKTNNNNDSKYRENITSKAHSEKLAKMSQVERGDKFIEKLKKQHPDRVKKIEETQTKKKEPEDVSASDDDVNLSTKDEGPETMTQQETKDLVSVFLMKNKIINECVGSDDKSSSPSPESQKDLNQATRRSTSARNVDISKKSSDLERLFQPLVIPANRRNFRNHEPEYAPQRKFSVPGEQSNLKQDSERETIDFRQALTSLREVALSKSSKEAKKKTKKRKGRKR